MKKTLKKGFTLIELLVVITIIGILATGASTVYISAQQKARDSVRQTDVMSIKSSVEQAYGDESAYPAPDDLDDLVTNGYLTEFPTDPKTGQTDDDTQFVYVYGSAKDDGGSGVSGQLYEISANYENTGSQSKELTAADNGDDDTRWEVGNKTSVVDSSCDTDGSSADTNDYGYYAPDDADYSGATTVIIDDL